MSKTLKMLKNTKKRGDFTKEGWEMFERENIALRKKKYQFIKKIEAISIFFSFIEIISKSLYCKPRNTNKKLRDWESGVTKNISYVSAVLSPSFC